MFAVAQTNIEFFQAVATVIPVLFLAAAFQARAVGAKPGTGRAGAVTEVVMAGLFLGSAVAGEATALNALADGSGSSADTRTVSATLITMAAVLGAALLNQVYDELLKAKSPRIALRLLAAVAVAGAVAVILGIARLYL